jgi:anti-sigma B factor antagonist
MTLTEHRVGDVTLLELRGRLVYEDGDLLVRQRVNDLVAEGRLKIVIDLSDVTYIDSCGVGELVARLVSVRKQGGDVRLLHLSARSHRVMEISHLLEVFETFDSREAAIASFSAPVRS